MLRFVIPASGIEIDNNSEDALPIKIKRQSVSFAKMKTNSSESSSPLKDSGQLKKSSEESPNASFSNSPQETKCKDKNSGADTNGRYLMSGHAKTHNIVINLDDKSRFTDEISV